MFKCFITVSLCLLALNSVAKMYKWVDEDGEIHYADRMPPEVVRQEHQTLNERGLVESSQERALTDEERRAISREQRRQEKAAEARRLIEFKRQRRDHILLMTFTTEQDLLLTHDGRLTAVKSQITLTESNNRVLAKQIDTTEQQIQTIKEADREVPENISKKLNNLQGQLNKNNQYLKRRRLELRALENQFAADLERFRELKAAEVDAQMTEDNEA